MNKNNFPFRFLMHTIIGFLSIFSTINSQIIDQIKITPNDLTPGAHFGSSLYMSSEYFIVGAPQDSNKGSAYIYKYTDTSATLMQKISPIDLTNYDNFGQEVFLIDNFALIGAPNNDEYGENSGVVYVYKYEDSTWNFRQKIYALNPNEHDYFGSSFSGRASAQGFVLIGAPNKEFMGTEMGAVYLFSKADQTFVYKNHLFPNDGHNNQKFGFSHSVISNDIIIGAPGDNQHGNDAGAIYRYLYNSSGNSWTYIFKKFASTPMPGDKFGYSLDFKGISRLFVGSPGYGGNAGKVFYINLNGLSFGIVKEFQPNNVSTGDAFGSSLKGIRTDDWWGLRIIIGSPYKSISGYKGISYIFNADATNVTMGVTLTPFNNSIDEQYGIKVSLSTNNKNFLIGAPFADNAGTDAGAVYFNKSGLLLPVELDNFEAIEESGGIHLKWSTLSEINNYGFEIERSFNDEEWITRGFISGSGTTIEKKTYSYRDELFVNGKYQYRLKQVDFDGSYKYSTVVEIDFNFIHDYNLSQNFPNPFNPTTNIKFAISDFGFTTLKIYDVLGNEIATLVNEEKAPGVYEVVFDAVGISSGIYFYQLRAGTFSETKKLVLLR
jgi:hypothetical protein